MAEAEVSVKITTKQRLWGGRGIPQLAYVHDWIPVLLNERHLMVRFPIFHSLCQELRDARMRYTVLYAGPDEPLAEDRLSEYKNLILPDVWMARALRCIVAMEDMHFTWLMTILDLQE